MAKFVKSPKAFISYSDFDYRFVYDILLPIFKSRKIHFVFDEKIEVNPWTLRETISNINHSDFFVSFFDNKNPYLSIELGLAIGLRKSIIVIQDESDRTELPEYLSNYTDLIVFSKSDIDKFQYELLNRVNSFLYDAFNVNSIQIPKSKLIGISVGTETEDIEEELNFASQFIKLIKILTTNPKIEFVEAYKGSFKGVFSIDFKSWTELLEKIIFIIPELKKKKAEVFKINAESEKILAETYKINSEANKLQIETTIQQEEALVNLLERYKKLGLKIQIDSDITLSINDKGEIGIRKPNALN